MRSIFLNTIIYYKCKSKYAEGIRPMLFIPGINPAKRTEYFPVSLRYCKDCSCCAFIQEGNSGISIGGNTPARIGKGALVGFYKASVKER